MRPATRLPLDLPGHGRTGATREEDYTIDGAVELIDSVTQKLGLEKFHLAGHSMGGRAAWIFAVTRPDRVDRLILVAASGHPIEEQSLPLGIRIAQTPVIRNLMLYFTPRSIYAASVRVFYENQAYVTEELVTRYHEMQLRRGSRGSKNQLRMPDSSGSLRSTGLH